MEKQVTAKLKNAKISPRKMMLVANLVRGSNANKAITTLTFSDKRGAKLLMPLVKSAMKNSSNNFNMNEDQLMVSDIRVGPGKTLKAGRFSAKGRFARILKRSTNIVVVLTEKAPKSENSLVKETK